MVLTTAQSLKREATILNHFDGSYVKLIEIAILKVMLTALLIISTNRSGVTDHE